MNASNRCRLVVFGLLALAVTRFATAAPTADEIGLATVKDLQELYYNDVKDCGGKARPAYLCSGVVFRATYPSNDYHTWDYNPSSTAVSFSYLRVDAEFRKLVSGLNSGFILYNQDIAPPGRFSLDYLCFFPIDGGTNAREELGCGQSPRGEISKRCDMQQIDTGQKWYEKYSGKDGMGNWNQCGFYLSGDARKQSAAAFTAGLEGGRLASNKTITQQNEFRIAKWSTTPRGTFPLRAFFYTTGGLENAQAAQRDYKQTSGWFAPVIELTLPQATAEDAKFSYKSADQVIAPDDKDTVVGGGGSETCDSYVESAEWVERYDPGTKKDEWTLAVVPTACGRQVRDDKGNQAFYDELFAKFGADPQWRDNDGGGMYRQVVCHMIIARNKSP
ncbi:DUF2599 domain-containing protein [Pseudomonas rubra]|uniref:DUF2599 domain-containing protein n=1 Tax=Pseudomonas rubra TaxID=2942627 RepID=A0ABT5P4U9_9PSED|nr:DUF2599 domain-containing protein [Pseudomonas rubra]MDD1013320.1 DUF2599 domain-containing protein [Pseudomonas rubra]MDD1037467.1 DUF2599 domain-containing protein [Pseudomonas rubra]MDD1155645.1 DUF2599 domain-containing protein [Pseudomonas rubra]